MKRRASGQCWVCGGYLTIKPNTTQAKILQAARRLGLTMKGTSSNPDFVHPKCLEQTRAWLHWKERQNERDNRRGGHSSDRTSPGHPGNGPGPAQGSPSREDE